MPTETPAPADARPDPLIGRVLADRYKIRRLIARGGMGSVYEAEQLPLGRKVAVKILIEPPNSGDSQAFQQRFFLEAATLAKLDHPHTVTLHDYGRTPDDIFYLVMEYVDGLPLSRLLKADGPLEPQRAIRLLSQVARALRNAHECGVIHRDLKPGNLLVKEDVDGQDHVKVVDFGLVKLTEGDQAITVTGMVMGSPHCMAPEQVKGEAVDERADIYALGVLLYRCVAGQYPFHGSTTTATMIAHINQPVPKLAEAAPTLQAPEGLEEFIERCLAKDPGERYPSMREVVRALRELSDVPREEFTAVSTIVEAPKPETGGNGKALYVAVGLLALAAIGLGAWALTRSPAPVEPPPVVAQTVLVSLTSAPVGAEVWLNGELRGRTPVELTLEQAGAPDIRRFEFRKEGYVTATLERDIASVSAVDATLQAVVEEPVEPVVEEPIVDRPVVEEPVVKEPVRPRPRPRPQPETKPPEETPSGEPTGSQGGSGTEEETPAGYKGNPFD